MFSGLSLRLRIFLFFCLIALGGTALAGAALWFGYTRAQSTDDANGFTLAAILIAFRQDQGRVRAITIAVMIVAGAVIFFGLAGVASQIDDNLVEPPLLWLVVALPAGALLAVAPKSQ